MKNKKLAINTKQNQNDDNETQRINKKGEITWKNLQLESGGKIHTVLTNKANNSQYNNSAHNYLRSRKLNSAEKT